MSAARGLLALGILLAFTGCRARVAPEPEIRGQDFTLEVHNPMPHTMNVAYTMAGSVTVLGAIEAGATRQFTIANRGEDEIELTFTDVEQTHSISKELNMDGGVVTRVRIEETD